MTLIQEAIEYVRNDTSRIDPIQIIYPDVEEHIHHEDLYKEDRLNEDIGINDIDIRGVIHAMKQQDNNMKPISSATIRHLTKRQLPIRMHLDSGANRSITPHKELLHDIKRIHATNIDGIGGEVEVQYEGKLQLMCDDDTSIWARAYYSPSAPETIVSPTDIALSPSNNFTGWNKHCDVYKGEGILSFFSTSGLEQAKIHLVMQNGLWYSIQHMEDITHKPFDHTGPIIRRMAAGVEHELWHQRLGHAGDKVMTTIHKFVDGIPDLQRGRNYLYKCKCCMKSKVKAAVKNKTTHTVTTGRGQQFHMDFGFVRGTGFSTTDEKGKIVTSRDGYNSYLIIVDSFTRYTWTFLSASKEPPLEIVKSFLDRNGLKTGTYRNIRCDQGGELARSSKFRATVQECGYTVEPAGAENSSQNGIAERPNQTFGDMLRSMLMSKLLKATKLRSSFSNK